MRDRGAILTTLLDYFGRKAILTAEWEWVMFVWEGSPHFSMWWAVTDSCRPTRRTSHLPENLWSGGFRFGSKSRKYHTSATDGGDTLPHYLSRCPASYITNSPKHTGTEFDFCHNTHVMVQCLMLQIVCLLFTSSLSLFLLPQTCHCLAKHVECYWAMYIQTAWVGVGVLYNSSRQLDSITPTREGFVRDGFKVGFSTLYFPSHFYADTPKTFISTVPQKASATSSFNLKTLPDLKKVERF